MCLILFAYKVIPDTSLVLAANRDEFFSRPTAPMHIWHDNPLILAGTDLKAGGTWLGINKNKKFAALTNYRDPSSTKNNPPSRGKIIADYLTSDKNAPDFLDDLQKNADMFNGFNLLLSDETSLFWFSNKAKAPEKLIPGIYGLSNHLLNTPWYKVKQGKRSLKTIITREKNLSLDNLFHILESREKPGDQALPHTGVGIEWERILAPIFINSPEYGTRSSTVMITYKTGHTLIAERGFNKNSGIMYTNYFSL